VFFVEAYKNPPIRVFLKAKASALSARGLGNLSRLRRSFAESAARQSNAASMALVRIERAHRPPLGLRQPRPFALHEKIA
jgi:hypothetical protein